MIARLVCTLVGHRPQWDRLADDTPIFRCARCDAYRVRETCDPRPFVVNTDPRFHILTREQAKARWVGLSAARQRPKSENADIVNEKYRSA